MQSQPRYQPGDKIGGRYQVHQALMGGMGEVYLCLDLETDQPFALKTFQQRFLNKTQTPGSLRERSRHLGGSRETPQHRELLPDDNLNCKSHLISARA